MELRLNRWMVFTWGFVCSSSRWVHRHHFLPAPSSFLSSIHHIRLGKKQTNNDITKKKNFFFFSPILHRNASGLHGKPGFQTFPSHVVMIKPKAQLVDHICRVRGWNPVAERSSGFCFVLRSVCPCIFHRTSFKLPTRTKRVFHEPRCHTCSGRLAAQLPPFLPSVLDVFLLHGIPLLANF